MNGIGINISAFANAVTPFSPVGKMAVGLENAEAKDEIFTPVEESSLTRATGNLNRERINEERREGNGGDEGRDSNRAELRQQQQDQRRIGELASRDREVRAHESAHMLVGGNFTGAASYTYQRGPDGVSYAVGGEVSISAPPTGDPNETLRAAEQIKRAALAPADPSAQDRRVASHASRLALDARSDINQLKVEARAEEARTQEAAAAEKSLTEDLQARADEEDIAEKQAREERLESLRQATRRSALLDFQLITNDNIDTNSVGDVLDQLI